jgi:hypothetical protein
MAVYAISEKEEHQIPGSVQDVVSERITARRKEEKKRVIGQKARAQEMLQCTTPF